MGARHTFLALSVLMGNEPTRHICIERSVKAVALFLNGEVSSCPVRTVVDMCESQVKRARHVFLSM